MNIERLERMALLLRKTYGDGNTGVIGGRRVGFHLGVWHEPSPATGFPGQFPECGTAACACGSAALDPWFQSQGFGLKTFGDRNGVRFGGASDFTAVAQFFEIARFEAQFLFDPTRYDVGSPQAVADRICQFIQLGNSD